MNTLSHSLSRAIVPAQRLLLIGSMVTALVGLGRAANTSLFWDANGTNASQGGNGTWDAATTSNWDTAATGGTLQTYTPNTTPSTLTAVFGGSGSVLGSAGGARTATVTIANSTTIDVNNVTFNNTTTGTFGAYTIAGGTGSVLNFSGTSANEPSINLTSNVTGNQTITANISNDSATGLVINLAGSSNFLSLNGNNSGLTGTTTLNLNGGTIGLTAPGAPSAGTNNGLGTSTVQFTTAGTINYRTTSTGNLNYGNNFVLNGGNGGFNVGGAGASTQNFTFGSLTFDTANTFTFAGSIGSGSAGRILFSNVVLAANGTLSFGATATGNATVGAVTQTGGTFSLTVTGGSALSNLTMNGTSSYGGATNIQENAVTLGANNAVGQTGTVTVGTIGTSLLNLNGFNQTVGGLASTTNIGSTIENVATGTSVLTYSGGSSTYGGVVTDTGTATHSLALTVSAGTLALTGTNAYVGATTVNGGDLVISSTGKLAANANGSHLTSAVTVSSGTLSVAGSIAGTVAINSGGTLSGAGGTIGALTVAGGIINTVDGVIGTLNGSTLALNGSATLGLEISTGSTADELVFSGLATIGSGDAFTVNVTALNGVTAGTYVIASASSGLTAADFSAGSLTNLTGYTATFTQGTGDTIDLVIQSSNPSANNYYFSGANSGSFTDAGNYFTTASGSTTQAGNPLSATSNVFLDDNSPSNTPPTLASTATINSLTFVTSGETLAGTTGNLTVEGTGTAGITDSATGGTTETIQPMVTLGASQGWTVASATNTLAVAGGVAGSSGQTLTLNGPGTYVFSSGVTGATYSGNTTLASGSLLITNTSGSALGTGTFTVARGATFGGSGSATGLAAFAIGTGSSGTTQIQVGNGTDTSSKLTLTALGASTISNANLTFNLSTTSTAANQLNLGNTGITFSNSTLTLNMTGGQIVAADTAYVLITDANGFANSGLTIGNNGIITGGLSLAMNSFFGTETNGISSGFYNGSYLFVNGDSIEVEVVPEPGTWALMLGGLGVLFFWQRRRKAQRA